MLDPFCGCGTTVHAAQKLNRRWIGIDVTHLAIGLIKRRLTEAFKGVSFDIVGVPQDVGGATTLADADKYEFQKWALSMIDAVPYKGGKKGGDGGVDGYVYFKPDGKTTEKAIVSVKGGGSLNPAMVKDLIVTVDQEKAKMGIFLTLTPPTKGMVTQAAAAGFYKTDYGQFPKIQIIAQGGSHASMASGRSARDDSRTWASLNRESQRVTFTGFVSNLDHARIVRGVVR